MAVLPLETFMCWKLKTAMMAFAFWTIGAGVLAMSLEILDIVALGVDGFEIAGGFKSTWRAHVWEGWLACNVVMIFTHILLITYSTVMVFAIKRFPTYYEFNLTKGYLGLLVIYMIVELGVILYKYSWYGANTFRLPYLVFHFMLWVMRLGFNITGSIICHSRINEVNYEITYGEKKNFDPYSSRATLITSAIQSGMATPVAHSRVGTLQSTSSYA